MNVYYLYIFLFVYFLMTIFGITYYFNYANTITLKDIKASYNVRNIILITKRLLYSKGKKKCDEPEILLHSFPKELYKYIRKPSPDFLSETLLFISTHNKTEDIIDINRCITISSLLFRKEIPLIFVKLDYKTRLLLSLLNDELGLRHVIVMDFYINKIKDLITQEKAEYDSHVEKYGPDLKIIGQEILTFNEEFSFSSLAYFKDVINLKYNKSFSEEEVQSLCTAYSAITTIKIPKMYINLDLIALSLIHHLTIKDQLDHELQQN